MVVLARLFALWFLLSASPATAQEATDPPDVAEGQAPDEAELERLEQELRQELGEPTGTDPPGGVTPTELGRVLLLPDISAVFSGSAAYYSATPTPRLRSHEPYHQRRGISMHIQELEVAFQAAADPYVRGDFFLDISLHGVHLEQGYLTTLALPAGLQLRAGKLPAAFGYFNTLHFLQQAPFVDMPLVNRRFFGGDQLVGVGFELSWLLPLPWYFQITVDVLTADNEVSFGLDPFETDGPRDLLTVGRMAHFLDLSNTWSLQLGASAAQGPNATGGPLETRANRTQLVGGDVVVKWRELETVRQLRLSMEYILRRATVPGGRTLEGGFYAQLDHRLSRHFEVAARYDYFGIPSDLRGELAFGDPAAGDPDPVTGEQLRPFLTPSRQWRVGTAVTFYASEYHLWRLQWNLDRMVGDDDGLVDRRGPIHEVFVFYQASLGPHGAHPF